MAGMITPPRIIEALTRDDAFKWLTVAVEQRHDVGPVRTNAFGGLSYDYTPAEIHGMTIGLGGGGPQLLYRRGWRTYRSRGVRKKTDYHIWDIYYTFRSPECSFVLEGFEGDEEQFLKDWEILKEESAIVKTQHAVEKLMKRHEPRR
jgi:hypothetical protein